MPRDSCKGDRHINFCRMHKEWQRSEQVCLCQGLTHADDCSGAASQVQVWKYFNDAHRFHNRSNSLLVVICHLLQWAQLQRDGFAHRHITDVTSLPPNSSARANHKLTTASSLAGCLILCLCEYRQLTPLPWIVPGARLTAASIAAACTALRQSIKQIGDGKHLGGACVQWAAANAFPDAAETT